MSEHLASSQDSQGTRRQGFISEPVFLEMVTEEIHQRYGGHPTSVIQGEFGSTFTIAGGVLDRDDGNWYGIKPGPSGEVADIVQSIDFWRGMGGDMAQAGLIGHYSAGYNLAAVNLSDISAMGARLLGFLMIYRYARGTTVDEANQTLLGVLDCIDEHGNGGRLVGGDTGGGGPVLGGSVTGVAVRGILKRGAARPGDEFHVIGWPGLANAARKFMPQIKAGIPGTKPLFDSWHKIDPQSGVGPRIAEITNGTAGCMDTSDGLLQAMLTMARMGRVGISVANIPVHDSLRLVADTLSGDTGSALDPRDLALSDSADFGKLIAINAACRREIEGYVARHGLAMHYLGKAINLDDVPRGSDPVHFAEDGASLSGYIRTQSA